MAIGGGVGQVVIPIDTRDTDIIYGYFWNEEKNH